MFGVSFKKQIRSDNPRKEWRTRARQSMKELCMGVKWLPIEGLYVGVRQLQLGVGHLPLEDLCVGVRLLQVENMNRSSTPPKRIDVIYWS